MLEGHLEYLFARPEMVYCSLQPDLDMARDNARPLFGMWQSLGLTMNAPVRRPRPKMHKFNHHEAIEMRRVGATYAELVERFGVDHKTIW
jgi:hypothetical protein